LEGEKGKDLINFFQNNKKNREVKENKSIKGPLRPLSRGEVRMRKRTFNKKEITE
jgi:hypothetical protein